MSSKHKFLLEKNQDIINYIKNDNKEGLLI